MVSMWRDPGYNSMQYLIFVALISTHDCIFFYLSNFVVQKLVLSLGTESHYIILAIIAYEDLQSESYTWFFGISRLQI